MEGDVVYIVKTSKATMNWELGCRLPFSDWAWLNSNGVFEDPSLRSYVAPFPPTDLVSNVSGLSNERDFAKHGVDIFQALIKASPKALTEFQSILDFGCGCGRLARIFKGHPNKITGCDVDQRHIRWLGENLGYVSAVLTGVKPPLPFRDNEFDAVISISVFTHLNEQSQDEFLSELFRITESEGYLFLTVHGSRALERARQEKEIFDMLAVDSSLFEQACFLFSEKRHAFILQHGHLTKLASSENDQSNDLRENLIFRVYRRIVTALKQNSRPIEEPYEYGITFIPEDYLHTHWERWFEVKDIRRGAIHDFQDIIVLKPKK